MSNIQESLHQFLLNQSQVSQIAVARPNQQYQYISIYHMPDAIYYMKGIAFIDFMLIIIAVLSQLPITFNNQLKYTVYTIMAISSLLVLYWAIKGIIKKYIQLYWGIFWCRIAVELTIAIFILQTNNYKIILWSFITLSVIIIVLQIWKLKTFLYVWLALSIDQTFIFIVLAVTSRNQKSNPIYLDYSTFLLLNIIGFLLTALQFCRIKPKWRTMNKLEKLFVFCQLYFYFLIVLTLVAGIMAYKPVPWPIYTIFNHMYFLILCWYFQKNTNPDYKLFKCRQICLQKSQNSNDKKQKLYQVSLGLLCSQQDYIEPNRQSVIGKPLNQCLCCISQQSTFCYSNCKHVCIGMQCAVKWLQKKVVKCPICRMESGVLIRVQRLNDFQFEVIGKYKLA